jgi:hypothetical protein
MYNRARPSRVSIGMLVPVLSIRTEADEAKVVAYMKASAIHENWVGVIQAVEMLLNDESVLSDEPLTVVMDALPAHHEFLPSESVCRAGTQITELIFKRAEDHPMTTQEKLATTAWRTRYLLKLLGVHTIEEYFWNEIADNPADDLNVLRAVPPDDGEPGAMYEFMSATRYLARSDQITAHRATKYLTRAAVRNREFLRAAFNFKGGDITTKGISGLIEVIREQAERPIAYDEAISAIKQAWQPSDKR